MIDLDCAYVASRSLGFDLRILLQTLPAVLVRRDPY
jgi:lipopolysaccharide/colanic/teichoic acid biosynthesis glycosyltransferase